ncbi:MAG: uncharacterized protein A8A55_2489 [Amphiamblys sp. WSBS2006]|nr:MAG: uncharacterized protein A8A55_2489 [Amphiamblys sp. WSBS2006]
MNKVGEVKRKRSSRVLVSLKETVERTEYRWNQCCFDFYRWCTAHGVFEGFENDLRKIENEKPSEIVRVKKISAHKPGSPKLKETWIMPVARAGDDARAEEAREDGWDTPNPAAEEEGSPVREMDASSAPTEEDEDTDIDGEAVAPAAAERKTE